MNDMCTCLKCGEEYEIADLTDLKCLNCGNVVDHFWPSIFAKLGPGRPEIKPEEKKRNFTTKLAPEWFIFLGQMKKQGHSKAWCIEQGLKLLKARFAG